MRSQVETRRVKASKGRKKGCGEAERALRADGRQREGEAVWASSKVSARLEERVGAELLDGCHRHSLPHPSGKLAVLEFGKHWLIPSRLSGPNRTVVVAEISASC